MNLSISVLKKAYQEKQTSPVELFAALREKAEKLENVWIHLLSESELQPYLDNLLQKAPENYPLWGVPFAIKDNIDLVGIPTTAACPEFSYVPEKSAHVVELLINAGAIPLGKTNLDQFATGLVGTRSPYGATPNAFDKNYISGGSSSGSAVSTASGVVSFALGTDTAGSGRVPACFNNLVGLKPSKGLLSNSGLVPACKSIDCISIFSLTADDARTVFSIAADYDESDCFSRLNPITNKGCVELASDFTFAVPLTDQLTFFGDDDYQQGFTSAIEQLVSMGGSKIEIDFSPMLDAARLLYEGPWVAERYLATEDILLNKPEAMMNVTRTIISAGATPKATDSFAAMYKLQALKKLADKLVNSVDVIVTPTAGRHFTLAEIEEEPIARNSQLGYYTNFMNLLDFAAIAVPTSFTKNNMPFGITLFSDAMTDQKLLTLAKRIQDTTQLPLGATQNPYQITENTLAKSKGFIDVVVCGAHLSGMVLNHQLTERGGSLKQVTESSAAYRMYAVPGNVERPAMIRDEENGEAFAIEVWSLPIAEFGSFVEGIAQPLGIGKVELASGKYVTGFIAEGYAKKLGEDITHFKGWRAYQAQKK
ncbi:MAG: allophanate hydrolase [Thalassotalea sp.]